FLIIIIFFWLVVLSFWGGGGGPPPPPLPYEINTLGFNIFDDDFGTGYSSLSYLAKYPIHGIKIDRNFVRNLEKSTERKELIWFVFERENTGVWRWGTQRFKR
ncbi:MAG: EAL domain-containing protein, partial [Cyanobacteria bacterium P01_F01_bin.150]